MADIDKELRDIKNEVYGRDGSSCMHDGNKRVKKESEESKAKADEAHDVMESIITEGFDNAALESNFEQKLDNKIANLQPEWTQFKDNVETQLAETVEQIGFASQYGFVADYEGNPQYDGNDENRITATDNTQAFETMLDDAIAKKNLTVYFPRGHYGIKTGNIEKDLTGCTLTIIGDGMENTIIDFIKEDDTKTSYVFPHQAN